MDCKKALQESGGDLEQAIDLLRTRGQAKAATKAARTADEGLVGSYVHLGGKIGVLIEVNCETDFVAMVEREAAIYRQQAKESGKPADIVEKIATGRLEKWYAEICLLEQAFVKDPDRKVSDVITEAIQRLGENIVVRRFTRYEIGV